MGNCSLCSTFIIQSRTGQNPWNGMIECGCCEQRWLPVLFFSDFCLDHSITHLKIPFFFFSNPPSLLSWHRLWSPRTNPRPEWGSSGWSKLWSRLFQLLCQRCHQQGHNWRALGWLGQPREGFRDVPSPFLNEHPVINWTKN